MIFFLFSSVQQNKRNKMLTIKKQTVPVGSLTHIKCDCYNVE